LVSDFRLRRGNLFYYVDEKPIGTPGQTHLDTAVRERLAMHQTLDRVGTHAEKTGNNVMVIIDNYTGKTRNKRVSSMYAHILGRTAEHPEMRRIIEPPMHVDSSLSSCMQFADWVAAAVTRVVDFQLVRSSQYAWVPERMGDAMAHKVTAESKLHLLCLRQGEVSAVM